MNTIRRSIGPRENGAAFWCRPPLAVVTTAAPSAGCIREKSSGFAPWTISSATFGRQRRFIISMRRVFLCDGDAIVMKTEDLLEIIGEIKKDFPHCRLISTYAGPRSTLSKTPEELKILHEAGLGRAYLGIETGMEALLKSTNKGVSRAEMLEAGLRLRNAGIDLWGIILIGLGGKPLSMENARETAKLINEMQPNHLSAMNYTPVEGTKLGNQALRGEFQVLSAKESLMETAELIRNLEVSGMHFTSDHASNYLPLKGTLNEDRDKLLRLIDGAIGGKVAVRSEASRGL